MNRRRITALILGCLLILSGCQGNGQNDQNTKEVSSANSNGNPEKDRKVALSGSGKSIVVYFSRVGNTDFPEDVDAVSSASLQITDTGVKGNAEVIAEWIADEAGCDTYEIVSENKYPADYDDTVDQAKKEQSENVRLWLLNMPNMDEYSEVYLVFPNWWADLPMPVYSFFDQTDFSGKRINVFITHEGSRFSGTIDTIKELEPEAEVVEAVAIKGGSVFDEEDTIRQWVKENRISSPTEETTATTEESVVTAEDQDKMMTLYIGETRVSVNWENNESVDALQEMVKKGSVTVRMSMYGGFEQVGSLGTSLPRNDAETTTSAGDIVLYSGNQVVVFYGSNSWAYTKLGRVTDKTDAEMKDLLGNGDTELRFVIQKGIV